MIKPHDWVPFKDGEVFGQLTVLACCRASDGTQVRMFAIVQCSCGRPPYPLLPKYLKGKKKRYNRCAYCCRLLKVSYTDLCDEQQTRLSLRQRMTNAISRCTDPAHYNYRSYG